MKEKRKTRRHWEPKVMPGIDLKGYEGIYRITQDGQIWSYYKHNFISQIVDKSGLRKVLLHKNHTRKGYTVHALMLYAFVGEKPFEDAVAMHIDGVPSHNTLDNLKWATRNEMTSFKAKGEKGPRAKLKEEDVRKIRKMYKAGLDGTGKRYTQKELAKLYGITKSTVWRILRKDIWKHTQ